MAERTVSVRLKALTADYQKAMLGAGKATEGVARSSANSWKALGQSTSRIGDSLTKGVTLPLVAAGAVAVKFAADFDQVFTQMQGLAGVSASEIDGLKESVLGLAGETGRAPQELAEALYFIRSAGLSGQTALDALEYSARAAAAGLGSTVQVADAVTNAINGYGAENITAAEATDVLVASVREGKAEAADMAPQFGRLVPVAAELGISFGQVGGALAYLTRASGDASQSSTQLAGIMGKLLRPTQQGAEALRDAGISASDLRRSLSEEGIAGTLNTLRERLGDSGFRLLFDDTEALNGALQITGTNAQVAADTIDAVADSAGATDSAFATMAESAGFKSTQAFAQLQAALIEFGDILIPILADGAGMVADLASAFSNLPKNVQTAIVAFLGLAAALGPIMSVGGRTVSAVSSIAKLLARTDFGGRMAAGFRDSNAAASAFSGTAGTLGGRLRGLQVAAGVAAGVAGIAGLALALKAIGDAQQDAQLDNIARRLAEIGDTGSEAFRSAIEEAMRWDQVGPVFQRTLDLGTEQAERFIEVAEAAGVGGDEIDAMRAALERKRDADVQGEVDQRRNTAAVDEGTQAFDEQGNAIDEDVAALQAYADQIAAQIDPLFGLNSALQQNRDAQSEVAAKELELAAARAAGDPLAVMAAEQALTDARISAGQSAFGVAQAEATLAAALQEQPGLISNVNSMLDGFVSQGLITEDEARLLAHRFGVLGDRVEDVPDRAHTDVSESGAASTTRSVRGVEGAVESIPRSWSTTIRSYTGATISNVDAVTSAVNRVPRNVTISIGYRVYGQAEANRAAALTGRGGAGGMIVPHYYAKGGVPMTGPRGTDTVPAWLTPGEMVLNDAQQAQLWAIANGDWRPAGDSGGSVYSPTVVINMAGAVIGSEHEAARWVSRAIGRAGELGIPITMRGARVSLKGRGSRQ